MPQTQGPVSFRTAAARHRKSLVYSVPWATGTRVTIPLNNVGYQNELQVLLALTVTVGTAGTVTDADAATSNFLPYIGLRSPQGEYIWSTNSRDIYDFDYRLTNSLTPAQDPSYVNWSGASATAQPVLLRLRIPTAISDGRGFDTGLLMRQVSNNQFYLDLQMAAIADLIGTGTVVITSVTGTITVEEIYYEAIPANANVIPPDFSNYIRLRSIQFAPLQNGQNNVRYDTGPVLMDAMHRLVNNSKADPVISNLAYIQLASGQTNEIDNRTGSRLAYDAAMHLGKALRAGVYHEDFCDDSDVVNQTLGRDFINSNLSTQLNFFTQYNGTPTGSSFINSFYREIVTLGA
ncbi:MAG: hypothetical protein ACREQ5_14030 [Candidatus Dormibacteria bacterium]